MARGVGAVVAVRGASEFGLADPVGFFVTPWGPGKKRDGEIADIVVKEFDLRPYSIIEALGLRSPVFLQTAAYGHFGKSGLPWERLNKAEDLKKYL